MSLSLAFALVALFIVLVVSLIVYQVRGPRMAIAAGGLTCAGLFAVFLAMIAYITSRM